MRAGSGVVLLISSVTNPSHSGSKGVTLVMMPQRAYVDFPTLIVSTLRGILKYSTDRPRAKEFGGMMHTSPWKSTKERGSNALGSTMVLLMLVKILNSSEIRKSYPYEDTPYEIMPARARRSPNGLLVSCSTAIRVIHRSLLINDR